MNPTMYESLIDTAKVQALEEMGLPPAVEDKLLNA